MSSLCSAGISLHLCIPCRFMSSLGDFRKHLFKRCSLLKQAEPTVQSLLRALISILCCPLKVSTGSSSFIRILSFYSSLISIQYSLSFLCQNNLTELKSFGSPVTAVTNVTAAVMVLMAPRGIVPRDRSWKASKVMMAKVDQFLLALINFDKENIPEPCLKAIRPYLNVSVSISPYSLSQR